MLRRVVRTRKYMKALASFPRKAQDAVETSVDALEGDWDNLDLVALKDSNLFRLRVGNYRVFFTLDQDGQVQIITILNVTRRTTTTYH